MFHFDQSDNLPMSNASLLFETRKAEFLPVASRALEIFAADSRIDSGCPDAVIPSDPSLEGQSNEFLVSANKSILQDGIGVFRAPVLGQFSWGIMFEHLVSWEIEEDVFNPFFFEVNVRNPKYFMFLPGSYSEHFLVRYETPCFRLDDMLTVRFFRDREFNYIADPMADIYFKRIVLNDADYKNPEKIAEAALEIVGDLVESILHAAV